MVRKIFMFLIILALAGACFFVYHENQLKNNIDKPKIEKKDESKVQE